MKNAPRLRWLDNLPGIQADAALDRLLVVFEPEGSQSDIA
jgi:hypothetical protein